jgi:hypothetical protein
MTVFTLVVDLCLWLPMGNRSPAALSVVVALMGFGTGSFVPLGGKRAPVRYPSATKSLTYIRSPMCSLVLRTRQLGDLARMLLHPGQRCVSTYAVLFTHGPCPFRPPCSCLSHLPTTRPPVKQLALLTRRVYKNTDREPDHGSDSAQVQCRHLGSVFGGCSLYGLSEYRSPWMENP